MIILNTNIARNHFFPNVKLQLEELILLKVVITVLRVNTILSEQGRGGFKLSSSTLRVTKGENMFQSFK